MFYTYFVTLEYLAGLHVRRTEVTFECQPERFLEELACQKEAWVKSISRPNLVYPTHLIHAIAVARID